MHNKLRLLALLLFPCTLWGQCTGSSPTWTTTPDQPSVSTCIASASPGDTVNISAGTATWTNGVSISGKAITVKGAGSARVIAYDNGTEMLTVGTGTLTVNIAGYSPGFSSSSIANGQTLKIFKKGGDTTFMQGTVTSLIGSVLTMNITTTGGSGTTHRWLVATVPATETIITNSSPTNALFTIGEDVTGHTNISNIHIAAGNISQRVIQVNHTTGGHAVLIHDMWVQGNSSNPGPASGDATMIEFNTNRGVGWNLSFTSFPFNISTLGAFGMKDASGLVASSWNSPSLFGSADTTGEGNLYIETSDFHAMGFATSTDDNGRMVSRHNLYDNSQFGTHGADTSFYGQRYFEFYNNVFVFNGYADGTTFNLNDWFFVRGGTFVIHDNTIPDLVSGDFGTKPNIGMIVMNLQRNAGANGCWGDGTHTAGQFYHAPRQVGFGYVTGTGTVNYPPLGVNNAHNDSITYGGDSEPGYIWNNTSAPLHNVSLPDGAGSGSNCACVASGTCDTTTNYVQLNRDYFNGTTAKPGYTPFTYPHPLAASTPVPVATFTPGNTVNMGNVPAGFTGNPSPTITLTNTGTANLVAGTISITNSLFSLTSNTCGSPSTVTSASPGTGFTLTPGQSCTFNVIFAPGTLSLGQLNAGAQFFSNTSTSPDTITLSGTATGPPAPSNVMFAGEFKTSSGCVPATGKTMLCFADDCNCWLVSMSGAAFRKFSFTGTLQ